VVVPCRSSTRQTPTRRILEVAPERLIEKFSGHAPTDADRSHSSHAADELPSDDTAERAPSDDAADAPDSRQPTATATAAATTTTDGTAVVVELDGTRRELSRADARSLRDALSDALTERREFLHTAGEHREDGSYVVERRNADSAGHRKVFERYAEIRRLFERLPAEFTAADVGHTGLTGGRRHMLVRHFAEHPAFDCELASRQPLTARKTDASGDDTDTGTDTDTLATTSNPAEVAVTDD
jgi:hypothetical protein